MGSRLEKLLREHSRVALAGALVVVMALGSGMLRLGVDTSPDDFVIPGSDEEADLHLLREEFGSDELTYVLVETDSPYAPAQLQSLAELQAALLRAPHVESVVSVLSIADDVGLPRGEIVADAQLLEGTPGIDRLVSASPGAGFLAVVASPRAVNGDGSFLSGSEEAAYGEAVFDAMDRVRRPGFDPIVASGLTFSLRSAAKVSLFVGLGIALLLTGLAVGLVAVYRTLAAALLPLVVIGATLICTLGLMGWTGNNLNAFSQVLVLLVVVAGAADSVHLLHQFARDWGPHNDIREASIAAVAAKTPAIVLTSLTTAAGFASFAFLGLGAFGRLGIFGAVGVLFAMVFSLLFSAALLPRAVHRRQAMYSMGDRLASMSAWSIRHSGLVLASTLAVALLTLGGLSLVNLGFDARGWLGDDEATAELERISELNGLVGGIDILYSDENAGVDGPGPQRLAEIVEIVTVFQIDGTPIAERVSLQALLAADLAGSDVGLYSADRRLVRLGFETGVQDSIDYAVAARDIEDTLSANAREGETFRVTGLGTAIGRSAATILGDVVVSYGVALLLITALMWLAIRRLGRLLVAMIPNLLPAFGLIALMGVLGIDLDPVTIIAGAIVIGISVDDTVHLLHAVYRDRPESDEVEARLLAVMREVGPALLLTTILVAAGFLSMIVFPLPGLRTLALLSAFAVVFALVADVVLLPAAIAQAESSGNRRGSESVIEVS